MKLICYLSNGYPTISASETIAGYYATAGCDVIEIDLPARNPFLENDLIKSRMAEALKECDDYDKYMDNIRVIKRKYPNIKVLMVVYESTVKEIGVEKFIGFCLSNDIKDIIYVGLENEVIKNQMIQKGIQISCYVQFNMLDKEIESAKASNGFVYMQAVAAPGKINPKFPTLADCIKHLRNQGIDRPIYCGVGVSTPTDFKMVKDAKGDGAFVGSTILKLYNNPEALVETIKAFKAEDEEDN
ncbi:MAG: tryptophan synthase subunit alpha [Oscillospiraceae bacterium]|nr:tryptophan synthase subunit alpha [Oscillospiraceae bacterium]